MARNDLLDQLDAVLPRMDPAEEVGQILTVMAKICRAVSAAVLFESGNALLWLAGDPLSEDVATEVQRAWKVQRTRVLTGMALTEMRTGAESDSIDSLLVWMRSPMDGGLNALYFAGPRLRPIEWCSARLPRLAALLGRINWGGRHVVDGNLRKSDTLG